MTDDRFFLRRGPFSLGELAAHALAVLPEPESANLMLKGLAPLDSAGPEDISVFCDARHAPAFAKSAAGAIVTSAKLAGYPHNGSRLVIARDPRSAFAAIGLKFYPRTVEFPGVNETALVDPSAELGCGCQVDSGAVIGPQVKLADGCHIASNAVIAQGVEIGEGSYVGANAAVSHALIGARVRIGAGTVIGGEGFGVVLGPAGLVCSAQLGRVIIGNNVRIGGNCTIDRGALCDTIIGDNTMLDNLVQIAHNVRIGRNCIFAGQAGVAGSATIGDNVIVGGQVAISDHLTVGSNVRIAGKSGVMRDIGDGETVAGYPAVAVRQWHRQNIILARQACKAKLIS